MQKVDLYQPLTSNRVAPPPLVIKALVIPNNDYVQGGTAVGVTKTEHYVLLSALPEELRKRVEVAITALIAGG